MNDVTFAWHYDLYINDPGDGYLVAPIFEESLKLIRCPHVAPEQCYTPVAVNQPYLHQRLLLCWECASGGWAQSVSATPCTRQLAQTVSGYPPEQGS